MVYFLFIYLFLFLLLLFTVSPIIEVESFEPMNRVLEGRNAYVFCRATGTFPMITNWFRGGELVLEKQRGTMLKITDATMYDTGRYSCTVKNPAGEATAETYVQIRKYRLLSCLSFKTSLLAIPFKWKWVWFAHSKDTTFCLFRHFVTKNNSKWRKVQSSKLCIFWMNWDISIICFCFEFLEACSFLIMYPTILKIIFWRQLCDLIFPPNLPPKTLGFVKITRSLTL